MTFFNSGQSAKDNGCIFSPSSIPQISLNSWFRNRRNSRLLIPHGSIPWSRPTRVFLLLKCARKTASWKDCNKPTRIYKPSKRNSEPILRKREKSLPVSTSYQIPICSKFYLRPNSLLLCSRISKKSSKTSMKSASTRIKRSHQ